MFNNEMLIRYERLSVNNFGGRKEKMHHLIIAGKRRHFKIFIFFVLQIQQESFVAWAGNNN
jgi:hypothetical protein